MVCLYLWSLLLIGLHLIVGFACYVWFIGRLFGLVSGCFGFVTLNYRLVGFI